MSVRKLTLPSGKIVWEVRTFVNGRGSSYINRRFDRRVDAENFFRNLKNEMYERKINPFARVVFDDRTFQTEAENWLRSAEIRFSPGTLLKARAIVRDLLPKYGEKPVAELTAEVISQFQQDEKKKGLEDATINRKCQTIIAILNFAVKQRRIPFNPAQGYMKLREAQKEASFWTREEAADFLSVMNLKYPAASEKRWVYVVYLVALNMGLRSGEIWGLKEDDLSSFANMLTVQRQLNLVTGGFTPTKNRRNRIVPCSAEVARELRSVIERNRKLRTSGRDQTIFQNERGGPIDHKNFFHRMFTPDLKFWGGKRIRFHDLRHTATTLMIASGVDIKTVKEICGHADIATTMNYVHLVASSVERVPALFSLSPEKV